MAKVLCSFSGIEFKCEYLPLHLEGRETAHPVFFMQPKRLLGLYSKYLSRELSPTEDYLLFLAYLNSTGLVEFRVPAKYTANTQQLIALHFDRLVEVCTKIQTITNNRFQCAKIAITPATSTLENIKHWLDNWTATYNSFLKGEDDRALLDSIQEIESRLQRLTGNNIPQMQGRYNTLLAEWASKAFKFPEFLIEDNGRPITLSNYWKLIIRSCQNQEKIFQFPKEDLEELRDHILDYIETAPKWGVDVLTLIEDGIEINKNFLGFNDVDLSLSTSATYKILSSEDTVEKANIDAIIQAAPKEEPREQDYPTRFAYLKAKMNYNLASGFATQNKE